MYKLTFLRLFATSRETLSKMMCIVLKTCDGNQTACYWTKWPMNVFTVSIDSSTDVDGKWTVRRKWWEIIMKIEIFFFLPKNKGNNENRIAWMIFKDGSWWYNLNYETWITDKINSYTVLDTIFFIICNKN